MSDIYGKKRGRPKKYTQQINVPSENITDRVKWNDDMVELLLDLRGVKYKDRFSNRKVPIEVHKSWLLLAMEFYEKSGFTMALDVDRLSKKWSALKKEHAQVISMFSATGVFATRLGLKAQPIVQNVELPSSELSKIHEDKSIDMGPPSGFCSDDLVEERSKAKEMGGLTVEDKIKMEDVPKRPVKRARGSSVLSVESGNGEALIQMARILADGMKESGK